MPNRHNMHDRRAVPVHSALAIALVGAAALINVAAPSHAEPFYTPPLEVRPAYYPEGMATLKADTVESRDGLPEYVASLTQVATGRAMNLGHGAPQMTDGGMDWYYTVTTAESLEVGAQYQYRLTIKTVAHWSCSVYNPSGCTWIKADTFVNQWRFTWNGSTTSGTPYYSDDAASPPPPDYPAPSPPLATNSDRAATKLKITSKEWWRPHTWKLHGRATCGDNGLRRGNLIGQRKVARGHWKKHKTVRSNRLGYFEISVPKKKGTKYRVRFAGTTKCKTATSKVVKL